MLCEVVINKKKTYKQINQQSIQIKQTQVTKTFETNIQKQAIELREAVKVRYI